MAMKSKELVDFGKVKRFLRKPKSVRKQGGFTLVEMAIVFVLLGLLSTIVVKGMGGSTDSGKAQVLLRVAQNMANNWDMVSQTCGTTSDVTASPIPSTAGATSVVSLLFGGTDSTVGGAAVATSYANCYKNSNILPLGKSATYSSSTWQVSGYTVTASGGGGTPFKVSYANVPAALALLVVQKSDPAKVLTDLNTAGNIGQLVSWTAVTSGVTTLTVYNQIN